MRTTLTSAVALSLTASAATAPLAYGAPGVFDDCRARVECRRLNNLELGRLRGGFTFLSQGAPLHVSFGIAQAVVINDELVAVTQLTIPQINKVVASFSPTAVDLGALAAALQSANSVLPQSTDGLPGEAAAAQATLAAGTPSTRDRSTSSAAVPSTSSTAAAAPPATKTADTSVPPQAVAASKTVAATAPAAAPAASPAIHVNGQAVKPGVPIVNVPTADELRGLIVQNGLGNVVVPNAADLSAAVPATIIQNTLNDQTIRALTVINVSVSVQNALSAARIQESVRQSIASSLR